MFSVILDFEKWLIPKISAYGEICFFIVKGLEKHGRNVCSNLSLGIRIDRIYANVQRYFGLRKVACS